MASETKRDLLERIRVLQKRLDKAEKTLRASKSGAEAALRQSQRVYRAIGESLDYGMWICSPDGRNTYASESFLKLAGMTQEQCSNFGWGDVLHPDDSERTVAAWKECVRTEGTWNAEHRIRGVDGKWHPILARGVPVRDEQGQIICWAGINLDISELKQAEESLRESEALFRTLANAIPQLCWMANADGWIFWYNQRWYDYTGAKPEQMEGWGWQSVHDPESLPKVLERWKASIATGEPFDMVFPLRGADGVFRPFLTRVMPVRDQDGKVTRWFGTNTDISEQRKAAEALRESEARERARAAEFEALMEAAPVGIFISQDAECRSMSGNRAAYDLLRRPRASNLSKSGPESEKPLNFRALKDGKEIPLSELPMQKAAATGQTVRDSEMEFVFVDGAIVNVLGNAVSLLDENGRPRGAIGAFVDISGRKWAEQALRESEERLRALMTASSDVVYRMNPDWSEMRQLFGRNFISDTEKPNRNWLPEYIHPDDQARVKAAINEAIRTRSTFELEHRVLRVDGTLGWTFSRAVPLAGANGEIIEWFGAASDITARKLAEDALLESRAKLEAALASMTDAVLIADAQGRFVNFNDAFATYYRFKNKGECVKTFGEFPDILDVFMPGGELVPPGQWVVPRALRGESDTNAEFMLRRKDTGETWFGNYSFGPICDKQGAIVGAVVTARDITARKREEQEIKALNAELEQRVRSRTAALEAANKDLEAFAYSVAHDLRSPLRGIDGWSLALLEDFGHQLNPQARAHLDRVRAEAQHMGRLIDDLLQLARVGRVEMKRHFVDLTSLAQSIVTRLQAAHRDRRLEFVIAPGMSCGGDSALLDIVLTNLLDNAVKFTRPRAEARIEFGKTDCDSESAFFVRDNGVGFDMHHVDKLFGTFQRLHKTSEFPGTGIGLATVKRVIDRHGGRVWAEGQEGEGASFYFTVGADL